MWGLDCAKLGADTDTITEPVVRIYLWKEWTNVIYQSDVVWYIHRRGVVVDTRHESENIDFHQVCILYVETYGGMGLLLVWTD